MGGSTGGSSLRGFALSMDEERATSNTTDKRAANAFFAVLNIVENFKGVYSQQSYKSEKSNPAPVTFF